MGEQQVEDAASKQLEENIDSKMEENSSARRIDMTGSVRDATEREDDHEHTESEMVGDVDESSEFMIITPQEIHDQRLKLKGKSDRTIPVQGRAETMQMNKMKALKKRKTCIKLSLLHRKKPSKIKKSKPTVTMIWNQSNLLYHLKRFTISASS
jgi:hypothetical protein